MKKKKEISGRAVEVIQEELDVAKREAEIMELRLDAVESRIARLQEELKDNCTHPADKVKQQSFYCEGSYLDRATTDYWNECTVCGTKSERTRKTHGYYG
jgi:hypothetical protein